MTNSAQAVAHYYHQIRATRPDITALDAYWSAKRTVHFRATLAADVADHKKRSKAAKKAWKTRRTKANVSGSWMASV